MKILAIGGNGTIGKKVTNHLSQKHEIIIGSRKNGDFEVDISNRKSILALFEKVKNIDAIVCFAGEAKWDKFNNLSEDDFYIGIKSKLMGQVNLVHIAKDFINPNGSITLTTGILADDPVEMTTSAALVNGAIHSFVRATQLELENGIRLNAVSLGMVEDAYEKYKDYFPGHNPIPTKRVINAYVKSIEGKGSGLVIRDYN